MEVALPYKLLSAYGLWSKMFEWILIRLLRLLGHLRCQKGGKIRGKHPFVKKELVKWEVNIRYSVKSSITSTWVASIAQFHIPFGILIVDSISFIKRFTYLLWLIVLAFSSIGIVLSVDFQHIKTMRKVINQCLGLSKYVASAKKFCDDISIAHMHIYAPNTITFQLNRPTGCEYLH